MTSIHDISVTLNDGTETTMADWAGHLLLIVNVASKCGLTPQYEGLQKLYEEYQDRGFFVIGVPCNQFNGQEPGTDAEVCAFAQNQYDVTFPLLSKTEVNGEGAHPLYKVLKEATDGSEIEWNWRKLVFMVQKEVAERMVAPPGGKDYGALSLAVQYHAQTELVTIVPPEVFYPQPKVHSAVIALHRLEKPPVAVIDEKKFFSLIKIAFAQRRKTLLNCLGSQTSMSKEAWLPLLEKAQIDPQRRGETLSMQEFATLADLWTQSVG